MVVEPRPVRKPVMNTSALQGILSQVAAAHGAMTPASSDAPMVATIAPVEKALLTAFDCSLLLNVSVRRFHELRTTLPAPVSLGPRCVRWRRADLLDWVARLPAAAAAPEPVQLARGKAARRGTPGGTDGGHQPPAAETETERGPQRRPAPSNQRIQESVGDS